MGGSKKFDLLLGDTREMPGCCGISRTGTSEVRSDDLLLCGLSCFGTRLIDCQELLFAKKMYIKARKSGEPAEASPVVKTRIEEKQALESVAIGAHVVHETIRREGREELKRSSAALAWSGLAAGLSLGFSLAAEGLLAAPR
jgi:hypothetical protein